MFISSLVLILFGTLAKLISYRDINKVSLVVKNHNTCVCTCTQCHTHTSHTNSCKISIYRIHSHAIAWLRSILKDTCPGFCIVKLDLKPYDCKEIFLTTCFKFCFVLFCFFSSLHVFFLWKIRLYLLVLT